MSPEEWAFYSLAVNTLGKAVLVLAIATVVIAWIRYEPPHCCACNQHKLTLKHWSPDQPPPDDEVEDEHDECALHPQVSTLKTVVGSSSDRPGSDAP